MEKEKEKLACLASRMFDRVYWFPSELAQKHSELWTFASQCVQWTVNDDTQTQSVALFDAKQPAQLRKLQLPAKVQAFAVVRTYVFTLCEHGELRVFELQSGEELQPEPDGCNTWEGSEALERIYVVRDNWTCGEHARGCITLLGTVEGHVLQQVVQLHGKQWSFVATRGVQHLQYSDNTDVVDRPHCKCGCAQLVANVKACTNSGRCLCDLQFCSGAVVDQGVAILAATSSKFCNFSQLLAVQAGPDGLAVVAQLDVSDEVTQLRSLSATESAFDNPRLFAIRTVQDDVHIVSLNVASRSLTTLCRLRLQNGCAAACLSVLLNVKFLLLAHSERLLLFELQSPSSFAETNELVRTRERGATPIADARGEHNFSAMQYLTAAGLLATGDVSGCVQLWRVAADGESSHLRASAGYSDPIEMNTWLLSESVKQYDDQFDSSAVLERFCFQRSLQTSVSDASTRMQVQLVCVANVRLHCAAVHSIVDLRLHGFATLDQLGLLAFWKNSTYDTLQCLSALPTQHALVAAGYDEEHAKVCPFRSAKCAAEKT